MGVDGVGSFLCGFLCGAFEHLLGTWDKGDLVIFEICCGSVENGDVLDLIKRQDACLAVVKCEFDWA